MNKLLSTIILCLLAVNLHALPFVAYDLGTTDGQPSDPTSEYNRLLEQIDLWNATLPNTLVLTPPTFEQGSYHSLIQTGGTDFLWESEPPFTGYLMFKWGDQDQFYYVKNASFESFENSVVWNRTGRALTGLSHWNSWGETTPSVPDGGTTMAFMGLGMLGLIGIKRKLK